MSEEGCCSHCGQKQPEANAHQWRAKLGSGSILAACEHRAWFECLLPSDVDHSGLWLAGAGNGLREYARGRAVLHGCAVSFEGVGISLVGPTRSGKSTLASSLCRRGWAFISDAMTAVDPASRVLFHQAKKFRLFDDSLAAIGKESSALPWDDSTTGKRRLIVPEEHCATPATQLACVFDVLPGEHVVIERIPDAGAAMSLVVNAYLSSSLEPNPSEQLLSRAAQLVSAGVQVFRLQYPRRWDALDEVGQKLESLLQ